MFVYTGVGILAGNDVDGFVGRLVRDNVGTMEGLAVDPPVGAYDSVLALPM
jgi:hypothetical protein